MTRTGPCHMPKSLLDQLPDLVALGRKEAEKILEGIESRRRVSLHTREVVLPAKDSAAQDWITQQRRAQQAGAIGPVDATWSRPLFWRRRCCNIMCT